MTNDISDTLVSKEKTEIQQMFEDFQETKFYKWLDRIIAGPYRWLILPITGLADAFVVVIPTEAVVAMYMLRNHKAIWWVQTAITSFFGAIGYVILALVVSFFGVDAVSWLGVITGEELATAIDSKLTEHLVLFATAAGITSIFPMPMTAFAVTAGLFGWSIPLLFVGAFMGKFVRFGIFAYGAKRWGLQALEYYMQHSLKISLVIVALILIYLFVI